MIFLVKNVLFIMFICNHCPFVVHVNKEIVEMANEYYQAKGVSFIAISSNDIINYPEDSPEKMKAKLLSNEGYTFPYLFDENHRKLLIEYDAACTPDFYVFDENKKLVYRGQLDDSRPGNNIPVSGKDIRECF